MILFFMKSLRLSNIVQHGWFNALLISALLNKNKEVMGENSHVNNFKQFDPSLRAMYFSYL